MSSDKVYNVVKEYYAETVTDLTDGNRITTTDAKGAVHYFDLDDAQVAKFEGTSEKGKVDTDWTAKDLTNNSYVYVQYDNSKSGDTHDALVVYDMYTKVSTTVVDGSKTTAVTSPVQYVGKAFADITVDLAANQTVTAATMKDGKSEIKLDVKNEDGKATISSKSTVTGDITITVTTDTTAQDNQKKANERAAAINGKTVTYSSADGVTSSNLEEKLTASLRQILAASGDSKAEFAAFEYSIPDYDYSGSGRQNLSVGVTVKVYDATASANITVVINH